MAPERDIIDVSKRPRGRPRKPRPEPPTSPTIAVWDRRFKDRADLVYGPEKVPGTWSVQDTLKRMGIAEHFTVIRYYPGGKPTIIQQGTIWTE